MATAARIPNRRPAARRRRAPSPGQTNFYFPQQIDNSRLVRVADPRERRLQTGLVVMALLLVAGTLLALYPRCALMRTGYRIEELKKEREQLLETNRRLRLEDATLRDPQRIDFIARNQLGLVPAAPGQVVSLNTLSTESAPVLARVQSPDSGLRSTAMTPVP